MINLFKKYPKICLFALLLLYSNAVWGQSIKKVKRQVTLRNLAHVKGKEQFGMGGGANYNGYDISIFYSKYLKKNILIRSDFLFEHTTLSDLTSLKLFYLSPEANYTVTKLTNRLFFNLKGGFIIGNERLTNSIMVNKKVSTFIVGEKIGMKFEFFIVPEFSLNLDIEQRFINNSKAGAKSALAFLSFSYNL